MTQYGEAILTNIGSGNGLSLIDLLLIEPQKHWKKEYNFRSTKLILKGRPLHIGHFVNNSSYSVLRLDSVLYAWPYSIYTQGK